MAGGDSQQPTGLRIGAAKSRSWRFVRCESPVPAASRVTSRAGHDLVREIVGFPHRVTLRCPAGALSEAAKLRLMKALSLGVERLVGLGKVAVRRAHVEVVVDRQARGGAKVEPGPRITLSPTLVTRMNRSLAHLRAAVFALLESRADCVLDHPRATPAAAPRPTTGKVLLFKNIFTKDVDGEDALQINPGIHYLLSPLVRAGVQLILLDGKLPLQDVCERPPLPSEPLAIERCISDPAELERALAEHPDLSLVCLTLLERSFNQIRELCRFIRQRSNAFIAVGGVMPTVTPEHAFAHLEQANFFVRGDGEQVLGAIVELVAGRTIAEGLKDDCLAAIARLEGVMARCGDVAMSSDFDQVNRVADLDQAPLDFSIFQRENVEAGLSISTSRGCVYACHFCSVMDRNLWRGKSVAAVMADLDAYERRLCELYGAADRVPETARRLQIWDDDFFIEPDRAAALLDRMSRAGFRASFIQGTIASFFVKDGRRVTRRLNEPLLDAIPRELFVERIGLKLGTENFCDRELKRLGKPYDYSRIRQLALALHARGIRQEHFRILCNRETSLDDLLDNCEKITELRWAIGPDFFVLAPSWLINLYPTALYRACQIRGTDLDLPHVGVLHAEGFSEFDYPFVIPEPPDHAEVHDLVGRFPAGMHFGAAGEPDWLFDDVHGPVDHDYLLVYPYLRRALQERRARLVQRGDPSSAGEVFRIDQALATRLAGARWVPTSVLQRVAPALEIAPSETDRVRPLCQYVASLLAAAAQAGDLEAGVSITAKGDGVSVEVEQGGVGVEFLVKPYREGIPCAFYSRNLAFIARSPMSTEAERQQASPIIEQIRAAVERHDTHELQ